MYSQEHQEPDYAMQDTPEPRRTDEATESTRWCPQSWFEWRYKRRGLRPS